MHKQNTLTRRTFLAAPLLLAPGVFAQPGRRGAGDRVVTGHIGVGARGRALLERVRHGAAAVCDVDEDHLAEGAALVGAGVRVYRDYRELLEQPDIDAVIIATPDHWHALQAVHACEAGKDVYIETPACRVFEEAEAILRAAAWYGRVAHVGASGPRSAAAAFLRKRMRDGALGPLRRVSCWGAANPEGGDPAGNRRAPATLDWDRWIGPSRWMPYNPDRSHGNWRWLFDIGGGNARQQGAELLQTALEALGAPHTGKVTVSAQGAAPSAGFWDCPTTLEATWSFSGGAAEQAGASTIHWRQPGPDDASTAGLLSEGEIETLRLDRCGDQWRVEGQDDGAHEDADPVGRWLDAVRAGRRGADAELETACRAAALATLANVAWRLGRPVTYDLDTGGYGGDTQAERLMRAPGRGPYRL
ncbi:MAG TPA: Gfo/Idh/MocA family oxidoreductase [Candidatus Hydrogenedentes bacterium]|nr:Gfo/Idh/MocA family oxidoreductase [Candidatus Hydrogenedentota bacterium]